MGWNNVKKHYRIGHIVQVTERGICIGSPYIPECIVIGLDGELKFAYKDRANDDLVRYQQEMDADPALLRRLVLEPDTFERALPVYTFQEAAILEKRCEAFSYPNVTHDGCLMYDNTFSHDRNIVIAWAKRDAALAIKHRLSRLEELEAQAAYTRKLVAQSQAVQAQLAKDFPASESEGHA